MAVWGLALASACDGSPPEAPPPVATCAVEGPAQPTSIAETVALVDALSARSPDGSVTLPCFLASLDRPLSVEATSDIFSAQPAVGLRSPRIFLRSGDLILTVVPEGPGRPLLELGERTSDGLTIKAEIVFPVDGPLPADAAYERVRFEDAPGTPCGGCHGREVEVGEGIYASLPLRPASDRLVPLPSVRNEATACLDVETDRCALLRALFGHGEVVHAPFPEDWPTIYDPR